MEDFNEEEETHKDNIQKAFVLIIKALLLINNNDIIYSLL